MAGNKVNGKKFKQTQIENATEALKSIKERKKKKLGN